MFRNKTPSGAPKEDFPYWLVAAAGIAVFLLFQIATETSIRRSCRRSRVVSD